MKILKNPMKIRLVTDCFNTEMSVYSKWLDIQFEKLVKHLPTRLKDSQDLLRQLIALGYLPQRTRFFTADATAMYTNIDTEEGIAAIKRWLELFPGEIPEDFPLVDCLLEILRTFMTQNVFHSEILTGCKSLAQQWALLVLSLMQLLPTASTKESPSSPSIPSSPEILSEDLSMTCLDFGMTRSCP